MIPKCEVCISSDISLVNSSVIFSIVFSSVITWIGIPGRISSFEIIWSFSPVAALALLTVSYPLFSGRASCIVRIFVVIGEPSSEAIAI